MNNNQINIKLKRERDDMNTWEVNDFLNRLSNTSYKYEVLNEIAIRINYGLKPENIIIMNNSFDFTLKYRSLKNRHKVNLLKESDVKALYHLGIPISFFPNDYIYRFNFTFQIFREINEMLRGHQCNRLGKDLLYQYAMCDLDDIVTKIKKDAISKYIDKNYNNRESFEEKLENIINKYLKKVKAYRSDSLEFDKVLKLKEHEVEEEYKETYKYIEGKYFKTFSKLFSKLERPIVGIYDENKKSIEILCIDYICRNNDNKSSVKIEEISHNSPLYFNLIIPISMAPAIYALLKSIQLNNQNLKIGKSNNDLKNKTHTKIDTMIKDLQELNDSQPVSNIYEMDDGYYKDTLVNVEKNLKHKSVTNFKNSKLDNNNIVINIKDYQRKKK